MNISLLISLILLIVVWRLWVRTGRLEERIAAMAAGRPALESTDPPDTEQPEVLLPETGLQNPAAGAATPPPRKDPRPTSAWGTAGRDKPVWGARLGAWLRDNWIYPAAGAALILSGVFLVQYAVDAGLLTPQARIGLAVALAAALGLAGEALRGRPAAGTILPATLVGSGIVIAMAAVLAALHLYDMIAPATALVALAALAFGAISLGWLHGPMMAALGLVAGSVVPFVLGGSGPPPPALFGYFALLSVAGLGIDTARRWGWVTWLALAGPLTGAVLWRLGGGDPAAFALALLVVAGAAMTLPFGKAVPVVSGPMALPVWRFGQSAAPRPGVRASFVASTVAGLSATLLMPGWEGPLTLLALACLIMLWAVHAPALSDQVVIPVLGLPAWIAVQALTQGPVHTAFSAPRLPESPMPLAASLLILLSILIALALLWRENRATGDIPGARHAPLTLAAIATVGGTLTALELLWVPAQTLGTYAWALQVMALAGLATGLALRSAPRGAGPGLDPGQGARLGASAAAAFALIALGLMGMLSLAALTVALAVLMVGAAAMDRRFDTPGLGAFQILASMVLVWRLTLGPGLPWLLTGGDAGAVLLSLAASIAGPLAALWLTHARPQTGLRRMAGLVVETGITVAAVIAGLVVIARFLPAEPGVHAQLGLMVSVLMALTWAQVRRMELSFARRFRQVLAVLLALAAGVLAGASLVPASPVFGSWPFRDGVTGWPILNDLMPAYAIPGVLLIRLGGWAVLRQAGWALLAVWLACVIRHLWQGPDLTWTRGVAQGELYAYTFAMLVCGAGLLARAIMAGRPDLRKLGLGLIALAAAKAFVIDAAGLDGLLRVGAFLALGLSLAALAWVNGWAVAHEGRADPQGGTAPDGSNIR